MFYLTLTKEQEETRSYISIPASPNASEAQIIPAGRANPNQKKLLFYEPSKYPAQITHVCSYYKLSLLKTYRSRQYLFSFQLRYSSLRFYLLLYYKELSS